MLSRRRLEFRRGVHADDRRSSTRFTRSLEIRAYDPLLGALMPSGSLQTAPAGSVFSTRSTREGLVVSPVRKVHGASLTLAASSDVAYEAIVQLTESDLSPGTSAHAASLMPKWLSSAWHDVAGWVK